MIVGNYLASLNLNLTEGVEIEWLIPLLKVS
jgi:hypothetical protein